NVLMDHRACLGSGHPGRRKVRARLEEARERRLEGGSVRRQLRQAGAVERLPCQYSRLQRHAWDSSLSGCPIELTKRFTGLAWFLSGQILVCMRMRTMEDDTAARALDLGSSGYF